MKEKSYKLVKWIWIVVAVIIVAGVVVAIIMKENDTRQKRIEVADSGANCRESFIFNGTLYSLCPYATSNSGINLSGNNNLFALCSKGEGGSDICLLPYYDYAWCEAAKKLLYTSGKKVEVNDPELSGNKKTLIRMKQGRNTEIDGVIGGYAILHGVSKAGQYTVRDGKYVLLNVIEGTSWELEIETGDMERLYPIAVEGNYLYYWLGKFTQNYTYVPFYRYDLESKELEMVGAVEDKGERSRTTESVCMLDGHIYIVMGDGELLDLDPLGNIDSIKLNIETARKITAADGYLWILTSSKSDKSGTDYHVYRCVPQEGTVNEEFSFTDERNAGVMPEKMLVTKAEIIVTMRQWKESYVWEK